MPTPRVMLVLEQALRSAMPLGYGLIIGRWVGIGAAVVFAGFMAVIVATHEVHHR